MPLDLFPDQTAQATRAAALAPVQSLDPGGWARFEADRRAMIEVENSSAADKLRFQIIQERVDRFTELTGEQLLSPELQGMPSARAAAYEVTRSRFAEAAKRFPELTFPTDEEIDAEVIKRARAVDERSRELAARTTRTGSSVAGFLGRMAGALGDPINMASMAFGAGAATGIIRTAAVEAGIGALSQAAIEAGTQDFRRRVDPNRPAGESALNIGAAALGGAVLGGGIKGIAAAWQAMRRGRWPGHVRDAGAIVQREAAVAPPQGAAPAAVAAHRQAVEAVAAALQENRRVEVPPRASEAVAPSRAGRVFDAEGRRVDVQYVVVPAADLTTSHLDDFAINPAFPADLQPRARDRAAAQEQVARIAGSLQPERLGIGPSADSGAPIVGPDGIVESGNGRVMALRRVYAENGAAADAYRTFLRGQGFDVAGIADPVLIARRLTALENAERVRFTAAANRSTTLRLSTAEQALADARLLDGGALDLLQPGDVTAAANRPFVRAFLERLAQGERGEMLDAGGALSQAGARRMTAALMGRAYGDAALLGRALEDADTNIRSIAGALSDVAGDWARLRDDVARGTVPAGMDVTRDLLDAIGTVIRARDSGQKVAALAAQGHLFGGPSEIAQILLRSMFGQDMARPVARGRLADVLQGFAEEARKNQGAPLLGEAPLPAGDVLGAALAKAGRADLYPEAATLTTPEAATKLAEDPAAAEAVLAEAERLTQGAAPRMVRVSVEDAAGNVATVEKPLDRWLAEADEELTAAREIEACAIGAAA